MNKSIFLLALLLIPIVSALPVFSGDQITIQLDQPYEFYSIIGNSTAVDLNLTQGVNNTVIITPNKYSITDEFEIIFFDEKKEVITIHTSSGGGGGGGTTYVDRFVNVTKFLDREKRIIVNEEVPGPTVVEQIQVKASNIFYGYLWLWAIIGFVLLVLIIRNFSLSRKLKMKGGNEDE